MFNFIKSFFSVTTTSVDSDYAEYMSESNQMARRATKNYLRSVGLNK